MITALSKPPAFAYPDAFRADEGFALDLDAHDPLGRCRELFHLPRRPDGRPLIYLCSHSLGLQPRAVRALMEQELDNWARLGVEGHFKGPTPWYTYQELLRGPAARLVGALPHEVILMNGLTVNLHLMLETFYRPRAGRACILMEEPTFPSDLYAVKSHLRRHGLDPAAALLTLKPRPGEETLRAEDIEELLTHHGNEIALVFLSAVNFFTGQAFDLPALAAAARRHGCVVGIDLAHAVGNMPLQLHDWQVDFAVWCNYKYICAGPGAIAGCFVHEDHGRNLDLPRLAGWWGNDPATRFRMQLQPEFVAYPGADGWQVSNPPVLALVPLRAALGVYEDVGLPALRRRSECLTAYLEYLLDQLPADRFEVITPRDPARRGCQLSMLVHDRPRELFQTLEEQGIIGDFRQPNVVRVAPVPLYNTFHEVYTFARTLARHV
jgi:kynureninase